MPTADPPKRVAFVVPALPSFRGNGLVMRAAATLKLLSSWADSVHLLAVPLYPSVHSQPEPDISAMIDSWTSVPNPLPGAGDSGVQQWSIPLRGAVPSELKVCSPLWQEDIKAAISALRPDLIFAFRFYLAPFLLPSIGSSLPVWLDVDELESVARLRLANLYASAKHPKEPIARMEVPAYQNLECQQLPLFQRLFAASDLECEAVRARFSEADARVMPNVYPFDLPQKPRQTDDHARLLFVGTFGYFPNKDALQYFVSRVLPKITERSSKPVEVTVVGSGILPTDQSSQFGLKVIGTVPDTTPYYASCDLVIVPLRAGGGTRIKILEAFSHQRAVVSTTVGAEGLAVKDGVELLIADDADVFAEQCLRLIENVDERARLAERGHQFFYRHHSLRVLEERMPYLFGDESAPIG